MNDPISEEDLVKTDSKCFFIRVAGWLGEQTIFNPKLTRDLAIRVGIIINFFQAFGREIATIPEFFFKACLSSLRNLVYFV